ncbi:two-partner secretion domain-containing protein, partial [Fusobacterium necrophorum]|uniref:two-partner secretion domain-containing protein n=1 Tax=Fusobacterium necrophorum TaxID=859 RepID=UPI00373AE514
MINGGVGYATEEVPKTEKSIVNIKPKGGSSIRVMEHTPGTIVDINAPNSDRVSHNIYDIFDMGENSKVLLNNSAKKGGAEGNLGFKNVDGNKNFGESNSATLIITEITGGTRTNLAGNLEVRNDDPGKHADLIFANENGINVNGIKYYDVGSVMYVNDRNWANEKTLKEREQKDNDQVKKFGNSGGSEGAIHKEKKSNSREAWKIDGGISENKKKLEDEKRKLEEERERLKREKERQEQERLERERQERERLEREQERTKREKERQEQERLE